MAIMMGSPFMWRPWGEFHDAVVTGRRAFDQRHGESFFEYLGRRPQDAAVFNAAMTSGMSGELAAILTAYNFSGCNRIVDVGGGHGTFLRGVLERYPHVTGVLCDVPPVVAEASARLGATPARCEFVGVDMFQSVPAGGDAYILRSIIHDWSDAEDTQILRNCRRGELSKVRTISGNGQPIAGSSCIVVSKNFGAGKAVKFIITASISKRAVIKGTFVAYGWAG
jgi:hypothetical protein